MDQTPEDRSAPLTRRRFMRLVGLGVAGTSLMVACTPAAPAAPTAKPTTAPAKPAAAKPTEAPAKSAASPAASPAAKAAASPAASPAAKAAASPAAKAAASPSPAAVNPNWQAEWDRTVAAAEQEGKVVVYGPPGDLIRRNITEAFSKAFPRIELEWNGGSSGQSAVKLEAERSAGLFTADVFIGGSTTANTQLKPMGAQDPIMPALILPEVRDPQQWLRGVHDFTDREEQFNLAFVNIPSTTVAYNTDLVQEGELNSFHDMLNPKWKDRLIITDPIPSGGGNAAARLFWHFLGPEEGERFHRALRAQAPAQGGVDRDARRMLEGVARGRFAFVVGVSDGTMGQLEGEGVKAFGKIRNWEVNGERVGAVTSSFGTLTRMNRAPHPNAQMVFMNWFLTKDGQMAYSTAMDQPSRRLDTPADHIPEDARPQPGVNYWRSYHEENVQLPPELKVLLEELYGRVQ